MKYLVKSRLLIRQTKGEMEAIQENGTVTVFSIKSIPTGNYCRLFWISLG